MAEFVDRLHDGPAPEDLRILRQAIERLPEAEEGYQGLLPVGDAEDEVHPRQVEVDTGDLQRPVGACGLAGRREGLEHHLRVVLAAAGVQRGRRERDPPGHLHVRGEDPPQKLPEGPQLRRIYLTDGDEDDTHAGTGRRVSIGGYLRVSVGTASSRPAVAVPPQNAEEPDERDEVLPVVLHHRDERAWVAGPPVGLVERRHHPARDIVLPADAEDAGLERTEPAGAERVLPAPAGGGEDIEVRQGEVRRDAVAGEPVPDVGEVERPAVEGDEGRVVCLQVRKDGGERGLLLRDRSEEILADDDRAPLDPGEANEDDRPTGEAQRLDIEEEKVPGVVEPADLEDERVGAAVPPPDPVRKAAGVSPPHREEEPGGLPAVAGVAHEVLDRPVALPVQPPPGRLPDPADQGKVGEDGRGRPVRVPTVEVRGRPGLENVARPGGGVDLPPAEDVLDSPTPVTRDEVVVELPGLPQPSCRIERMNHLPTEG